MPKAFDNCVRHGGRVRTLVYNNHRLTHARGALTKVHQVRPVCFSGGRSYVGHLKTIHPHRR
jgi:hypothetical protein